MALTIPPPPSSLVEPKSSRRRANANVSTDGAHHRSPRSPHGHVPGRRVRRAGPRCRRQDPLLRPTHLGGDRGPVDLLSPGDLGGLDRSDVSGSLRQPGTASAGSVFTNIDRHVAGSEPSHMMRGRRAPSVPFSCQPVFTVVHRTARSPYPGPADDSRMGPPHTCPSRSSTAGRPDRHQRDKRCGEDSDRRNGLWRPHRYQGLRKAAQLDHTSTTQAVAMSHTTAKQALSEAAEEVSKPRTSRASPGASSTGPPSPPTVRISQ